MNLNQKFSILFRIKHDKVNKQGFAPIWTRITIDGQRSEFSTQRKILCKHWDAENTIVKKECPDARSINNFLVLMRADLTRHYNILLTIKDHVFADDVKNSYKDIQEEKKTFFQLYDLLITFAPSNSSGGSFNFDVILHLVANYLRPLPEVI